MTCRAVLCRSIILLIGFVAFGQPVGAQASKRPYAPGHWVVSFTSPQGMSFTTREVTGGTAVGQVVSQTNPDGTPQKHIGAVAYEPLKFSIPVAEGGKLLQDLLSAKETRLSGSVVTVDFSGQPLETRTFGGAQWTKIELSTLDAASKEPAFIQVELAPEQIQSAAGGDAVKTSVSKTRSLASSFRVEMDGLPSNRVAKVEGIALERKLASDAIGAQRDYQKSPGALEISDLTVTFSQVDAKQWQQWFHDFVIKGDNGPDREKTLTVELLAPDMKQSLLTLRAKGVGIYALRPAATSAGTEGIARMEAKLYVEGWEVVSSGVAAR